ncbi:unnamed protein product [Pedinophyceae sp. YPF-701]|nr:unnamed protein product [Pedinophyceae sp. YPF-701]
MFTPAQPGVNLYDSNAPFPFLRPDGTLNAVAHRGPYWFLPPAEVVENADSAGAFAQFDLCPKYCGDRLLFAPSGEMYVHGNINAVSVEQNGQIDNVLLGDDSNGVPVYSNLPVYEKRGAGVVYDHAVDMLVASECLLGRHQMTQPEIDEEVLAEQLAPGAGLFSYTAQRHPHLSFWDATSPSRTEVLRVDYDGAIEATSMTIKHITAETIDANVISFNSSNIANIFGSNVADLSAFSNRLVAAENDIDALESSQQTQDGTLAIHGTRLTALEGSDASQGTRIAALEANDVVQDSRLDALEVSTADDPATQLDLFCRNLTAYGEVAEIPPDSFALDAGRQATLDAREARDVSLLVYEESRDRPALVVETAGGGDVLVVNTRDSLPRMQVVGDVHIEGNLSATNYDLLENYTCNLTFETIPSDGLRDDLIEYIDPNSVPIHVGYGLVSDAPDVVSTIGLDPAVNGLFLQPWSFDPVADAAGFRAYVEPRTTAAYSRDDPRVLTQGFADEHLWTNDHAGTNEHLLEFRARSALSLQFDYSQPVISTVMRRTYDQATRRWSIWTHTRVDDDVMQIVVSSGDLTDFKLQVVAPQGTAVAVTDLTSVGTTLRTTMLDELRFTRFNDQDRLVVTLGTDSSELVTGLAPQGAPPSGGGTLEQIADIIVPWRWFGTDLQTGALTSNVYNLADGDATSNALVTVRAALDSKLETVSWTDVTGKPIAFAPSAHTHSSTEITGLQTELDAKLETVSWSDVLGKPATFPPSAHTHAVGDVTGLSVELGGLDVRLTAEEDRDTYDELTVETELTEGVDLVSPSEYAYVDALPIASLLVDEDAFSHPMILCRRAGATRFAVHPLGRVVAEFSGDIVADNVSYTGHLHAVGDITGLQAALDAKLEVVTWEDVGAKPLEYPPLTHTHTWAQVTGVPSQFPPGAHTHDWTDITGTPVTYKSDWNDMINQPSTFPPSAHAHSWTDITDKPTSFPPTTHVHAWTEVTGKPSTFPPSSHTHAQSQVTGLEADLADINARIKMYETSHFGWIDGNDHYPDLDALYGQFGLATGRWYLFELMVSGEQSSGIVWSRFDVALRFVLSISHGYVPERADVVRVYDHNGQQEMFKEADPRDPGNIERLRFWIINLASGQNTYSSGLYVTGTSNLEVGTNTLVADPAPGGFVGIGTNAPAVLLDVAGTAQVSGTLTAGDEVAVSNTEGASGVAKTLVSGYFYAGTPDGWGDIRAVDESAQLGGVFRGGHTQNVGAWAEIGTTAVGGSYSKVLRCIAGQVGIGTDSPSATLDVAGQCVATNLSSTATGSLTGTTVSIPCEIPAGFAYATVRVQLHFAGDELDVMLNATNTNNSTGINERSMYKTNRTTAHEVMDVGSVTGPVKIADFTCSGCGGHFKVEFNKPSSGRVNMQIDGAYTRQRGAYRTSAFLSQLAYLDNPDLADTLARSRGIYIDRELSTDEVLVARQAGNKDVIVALRGTELSSARDIVADLRVATGSRNGFRDTARFREADDIVQRALDKHGGSGGTLWVTGHSLGGSLTQNVTINVGGGGGHPMARADTAGGLISRNMRPDILRPETLVHDVRVRDSLAATTREPVRDDADMADDDDDDDDPQDTGPKISFDRGTQAGPARGVDAGTDAPETKPRIRFDRGTQAGEAGPSRARSTQAGPGAVGVDAETQAGPSMTDAATDAQTRSQEVAGTQTIPLLRLERQRGDREKRGGGKTSFLLDFADKLLRWGQVDHVYWVSPTSVYDAKTKHFAERHPGRVDSIGQPSQALRTFLADQEFRLHRRDVERRYAEVYDHWMRHGEKRLDDEGIEMLIAEDFREPDRKLADVKPHVLVVFDDCVGNADVYPTSKNHPMIKAVLRHRHLGISFLFAVQRWVNSVPKTIRQNVNCYVLSGGFADREKQMIAEDLSDRHNDEAAILDMYERATQGPFDMLVHFAEDKIARQVIVCSKDRDPGGALGQFIISPPVSTIELDGEHAVILESVSPLVTAAGDLNLYFTLEMSCVDYIQGWDTRTGTNSKVIGYIVAGEGHPIPSRAHAVVTGTALNNPITFTLRNRNGAIPTDTDLSEKDWMAKKLDVYLSSLHMLDVGNAPQVGVHASFATSYDGDSGVRDLLASVPTLGCPRLVYQDPCGASMRQTVRHSDLDFFDVWFEDLGSGEAVTTDWFLTLSVQPTDHTQQYLQFIGLSMAFNVNVPQASKITGSTAQLFSRVDVMVNGQPLSSIHDHAAAAQMEMLMRHDKSSANRPFANQEDHTLAGGVDTALAFTDWLCFDGMGLLCMDLIGEITIELRVRADAGNTAVVPDGATANASISIKNIKLHVPTVSVGRDVTDALIQRASSEGVSLAYTRHTSFEFPSGATELQFSLNSASADAILMGRRPVDYAAAKDTGAGRIKELYAGALTTFKSTNANDQTSLDIAGTTVHQYRAGPEAIAQAKCLHPRALSIPTSANYSSASVFAFPLSLPMLESLSGLDSKDNNLPCVLRTANASDERPVVVVRSSAAIVCSGGRVTSLRY